MTTAPVSVLALSLCSFFLVIRVGDMASSCCLNSPNSNCSSLNGDSILVTAESNSDDNICKISVENVQNSSSCIQQCPSNLGKSCVTEPWVKGLLISVAVTVYGLVLIALVIVAVFFIFKFCSYYKQRCSKEEGIVGTVRRRATTASNAAYGVMEHLRGKRGGTVKTGDEEEAFYANPEYNTVQSVGTDSNPYRLSTSLPLPPVPDEGADTKTAESEETDELEYSYTDVRFPDKQKTKKDSRKKPPVKDKQTKPAIPDSKREGKGDKNKFKLEQNMAYNSVTVEENGVGDDAVNKEIKEEQKSPTVVLVLNTQQPSLPSSPIQLVQQLTSGSSSSASPASFQFIPTLQQSGASPSFRLISPAIRDKQDEEEKKEDKASKRVSALAMGFENLIKVEVKKDDSES